MTLFNSARYYVQKLRAAIHQRGSFTRTVTSLATATATSQVILLLTSPALARLYSPEDLGVLAIYTAAISLVAAIASLRYDLAIPLAPSTDDAKAVLHISLITVLLVSLATGLVLAFFASRLTKLLNLQHLDCYTLLLPTGVALLGTYQAFHYWALRSRSLRSIAKAKLTQAVVTVSTQVALAIGSSGPNGLVAGHLAGSALGAGALAALTWPTWAPDHSTLKAPKLLSVARRYATLPTLGAVPAILNSLGLQLPLLLLTSHFGPSTAGHFSLAHRVLSLPLSLLSSSTSQAVLAHASDSLRQSRPITPLIRTIIWQQLIIAMGILPLLPLLPFFFRLLFGSEWSTAGIYAAIWLPAVLTSFIVAPTGCLLDVLERQDLFLCRELLRLGLIAAWFLLTIKLPLTPTASIATLSVLMCVFSALYLAISFYPLRHRKNLRS